MSRLKEWETLTKWRLEKMRATLLSGTALLTATLLMGSAVAQNQQQVAGTGQFCIKGASGPIKCEYQTMAQCEQSRPNRFARSMRAPLGGGHCRACGSISWGSAGLNPNGLLEGLILRKAVRNRLDCAVLKDAKRARYINSAMNRQRCKIDSLRDYVPMGSSRSPRASPETSQSRNGIGVLRAGS
jgi:hypothetical protein